MEKRQTLRYLIRHLSDILAFNIAGTFSDDVNSPRQDVNIFEYLRHTSRSFDEIEPILMGVEPHIRQAFLQVQTINRGIKEKFANRLSDPSKGFNQYQESFLTLEAEIIKIINVLRLEIKILNEASPSFYAIFQTDSFTELSGQMRSLTDIFMSCITDDSEIDCITIMSFQNGSLVVEIVIETSKVFALFAPMVISAIRIYRYWLSTQKIRIDLDMMRDNRRVRNELHSSIVESCKKLLSSRPMYEAREYVNEEAVFLDRRQEEIIKLVMLFASGMSFSPGKSQDGEMIDFFDKIKELNTGDAKEKFKIDSGFKKI